MAVSHGIITLGAAFIAALILSSCSRYEGNVAFDGIYFNASASAPRKDRADMTVRVRRATQNLSAAAEAGQFAGIKHCVRYFGNSDIAWTVSPKMPDPTVALDGNSLYFKGRCLG